MLLNKKEEKKINEIVSFSYIIFNNPVTKEDVISRIENVEQSQGSEAALNALEYTYKDFKQKANTKEKEFWNGVKWQLMHKKKSVPTSVKYLKEEILNGNIDVTGIESEAKVRELLNI